MGWLIKKIKFYLLYYLMINQPDWFNAGVMCRISIEYLYESKTIGKTFKQGTILEILIILSILLGKRFLTIHIEYIFSVSKNIYSIHSLNDEHICILHVNGLADIFYAFVYFSDYSYNVKDIPHLYNMYLFYKTLVYFYTLFNKIY